MKLKSTRKLQRRKLILTNFKKSFILFEIISCINIFSGKTNLGLKPIPVSDGKLALIKFNMHAFDIWVEVFRVFREYKVLRERPEPAGGFTPRVQLFRRCNLKK